MRGVVEIAGKWVDHNCTWGKSASDAPLIPVENNSQITVADGQNWVLRPAGFAFASPEPVADFDR